MISSYIHGIFPRFFLRYSLKDEVFDTLNLNVSRETNNIIINQKHIINFLYLISTHMNTQFKCFIDLTSSDFPNNPYRFLCSYNIASLFYNMRFLFKVCLNKNYIDSITCFYNSASWFERECWDLFGIYFLNNIDLRRILNDYGFFGHPLKKDFPLSGFFEVSFSFYSNLVDYKYIKMIQEFRFFNTQSPWEFYLEKYV